MRATDGLAGTEVDVRDQRPEDPDLVGGLVRAGAAEPGGPVGGHGQQPDAGVRGLEHRRVQVGDRRARGADDGGPAADLREAEGEEAGRALVDAGVQPDQPGGRGVERRERQRGVARARCHHDFTDTGLDQRRDDVTGQLGRGHEDRSWPTARTSASRARQWASRSGRSRTAAEVLLGHLRKPHGQIPVDGREPLVGDVVGQQADRGQSGVVLELRQGRRQGDPGGQPDRRLESRRHDCRQPDVLGDAQARPDPTERLHLQHRDVGRLELPHPVGIGRPSDRLVRGDEDRRTPPHRRQILDRGARLLDVLQAAGRPLQQLQRRDGGVDVPGPVGVHADPSARAERVAHGLEPGLVLGERARRVGHLDLGGPAARAGHQRVRLLGREHRHRHVDRHPVAHRLRPVARGRLLRTAQPGGGLVVVIL